MIHHFTVQQRTINNPASHADSEEVIACPIPMEVVPAVRTGMNVLDSSMYRELDEAGCPLGAAMSKRLSFEALLTELSAMFVNIPASEVDAHIEWGLRRIVEMLDMDRSGLGEVSADGKQLLVTHSYQLPGVPPSAKIMLSSELPVYTRLIHQGAVIRLPDDLPPDATGEREYCARTGLKTNLTIPLMVMGNVVGGIGFTSVRSSRCLPDELIPRLRMIGDIFTNALARKRADETLKQKEKLLRQAKDGLRQLTSRLLISQEEERSRIAREMHDDWTQRLAVLGIDAANLESQLTECKMEMPMVNSIRQRLVSLADDVHALSRQLHPSIIDDLGLAEALRSECSAFSQREAILIDLRIENVPPDLPQDIALSIYRVAQEGLRNLAKHAAVNEASLKLFVSGSELVLQVRDEGVGFDAKIANSQPGLGLSSMEERVHLLDGTIEISSQPGQGTSVEVHVPLSPGGFLPLRAGLRATLGHMSSP
ncbi:GAF domain-containing sensor histidine kinase [Novipirellula artificiosorum]|uniref:Oxygen sensor histidine kinase NreB n=1 Tax=Novipirellula artificiosorum TaxID=2528016 RepID=A0A5C6D8J2_9BACT|nr:GAF domain-containing sensor histidine kinase [Novipirellula artificiosorum]TWU33262.1 Oxygen sensor histidine kinase NreB [Novipirellula artificiosorum]